MPYLASPWALLTRSPLIYREIESDALFSSPGCSSPCLPLHFSQRSSSQSAHDSSIFLQVLIFLQPVSPPPYSHPSPDVCHYTRKASHPSNHSLKLMRVRDRAKNQTYHLSSSSQNLDSTRPSSHSATHQRLKSERLRVLGFAQCVMRGEYGLCFVGERRLSNGTSLFPAELNFQAITLAHAHREISGSLSGSHPRGCHER